jgi:N6-adenosine-specific RNA methylase IME4/ParB-like chromosome segregation protein Spo0J
MISAPVLEDGAAQVRQTSWPTDELREHPQAAIVPAMSERAFAEFRLDIDRRGLLVPLEITAEGVVLDGKERLRAALVLGIELLPVRVVSPEDEIEHMILCALERRQLSASQRAALAVELDGYRALRAGAQTRRLQNLRQNAEVAALPPRGKSREIAAAWAGVSPRTLQDALTVHEHDPDLFRRVKEGDVAVDIAARRVRRFLRDRALPDPPPPPEGPFDLIYADPPWQLGRPDGRHAPENHYPTMPLEEIKRLHVPAADDAVLLLWAVNCLLPQALQVIEAWGFSYLTNLVWVKPSIGLGVWTRNRHELLLLARRGSISPPYPDLLPDSVITAARGRHSEKPACVYELIERAYPHLSKLELFARTCRPGWTGWGNEAAQP